MTVSLPFYIGKGHGKLGITLCLNAGQEERRALTTSYQKQCECWVKYMEEEEPQEQYNK